MRLVVAGRCWRWWLFFAFSSMSSIALAVDRSKFRTCQQTSFCRRHRDGHSSRLYQYELVPNSLQFHGLLVKEELPDKKSQDSNKKPTPSMWSSLSRMLGKSPTDHGAAGHGGDPHVRGTRPTLTGIIRNAAKETSTGNLEQLQWSLYAMEKGILRIRVTETYGIVGSAYERPRVTYDELVLDHPQQWKESSYAQWVRPSDAAGEASEDNDLLLRLVQSIGGNSKSNTDISAFTALRFGDSHDTDPKGGTLVLIRLKPFAIYVFRSENLDAGPVVALNEQSLMSFEIRRFKDGTEPQQQTEETGQEQEENEKKHEKEIVGYWEDGLAIYSDGTREEKKETKPDESPDEDHRKLSEQELHDLDRQGLWEESFDSHIDSKPYGPMSVGLDISFPKSSHLYGLPEHASSAVLKTTFAQEGQTPAHYKEPYRLYNLDVFEYELDEPMALYGVVPLILSQSAVTGTTGVFWFNPTETFVDVVQNDKGQKEMSTHWMSESGILDVFVLPGPDPASLYQQYARVTGVTPIPPMFSLGYHQCRWNYRDEKDVYEVHGKFEELDYPYDVLWLDIEHTDGKRYFTWDEKLFPNPVEMQEKLWSTGRRMVTIIDPHIKRDDEFAVHSQATSKGLYIKDKNGKNDYDGWCWPGSSSYLDFTSEKVRSWWAELFAYNKYRGSAPTLFTWNDMNEPSVFNGPEVSMQKDLRSLDGEEHREWHNLYGMLFHRASSEGLIARNEKKNIRPFVLSRAFFAGSQKYGAIWTGDNKSAWGHLQVAAPMLLSLNMAALSFVGSDVGGFFGNPDAELFTRWMQAGAYQPFFRGHGHHDSKRKEPWMFDEDTLKRCRRAAMSRYALLPMWYTLFHQAETTGMPVMRMMWMEYPKVTACYDVDSQYMLGSDLLVHPVTEPGATEVNVIFPSKDVWYDADTLEIVASGDLTDENAVISKSCPAGMDTIPVFQRGGSILSRKLRLRRSSSLMKSDPYTLFVALDRSSKAVGTLYMDDEETFHYRTKADYAKATFVMDWNGKTMTCSVQKGKGWNGVPDNRMVERIVVAGVHEKPKAIAKDGNALDFDYDAQLKVLVIRKPNVSASQDWTIQFS